jgi:hypothetical protein
MAEFSERSRAHRLLVNLLGLPMYVVFAWIGLLFDSHLVYSVPLLVIIAGIIDTYLHRQTASSLKRKTGMVPVRDLCIGLAVRQLGVIAVVVACTAVFLRYQYT